MGGCVTGSTMTSGGIGACVVIGMSTVGVLDVADCGGTGAGSVYCTVGTVATGASVVGLYFD